MLNRSPHDEILRTRLRHAQALLQQTQMPISEVALRSGFTHPEYLNVAFKRELFVTPGTFRRQLRSERMA